MSKHEVRVSGAPESRLDDVCLVSTWDVPCGIASYTAGLRRALEGAGVSTSVLPIDRVALGDLARSELAHHFVDLGRRAAEHPVVHLQHEFAFFGGAYGHPEAELNLRRFLRAARRGCRRIVITFHSLPPVTSWPDRTFEGIARDVFLAQLWRRTIPGLIDGNQVRAVAPSRYQRRLLIDSGVRAAAISVVPQGAPTLASSSRSRAAAREVVGMDEDAVVVLLFGFVAAHKGHLVAADALRSLPSSHHLVVLGGPHPHGGDAAYEQLLAAARRPALAKRLHITGWVNDDEAADWFAAADLCVAPYLDRRLVTSAAAVWALASGRPLVASRIPVFDEMVADWDCAELVTIASPNHLAEAIVRLGANEERAKVLVDNAARLCEKWSWPNVAAEHLRLYS